MEIPPREQHGVPPASQGQGARLLRRWPPLWALVLVAPAALAVTSMSVTMAAAAIVVGIGITPVTALAMTALGCGGLFVFSPSLAWVAHRGVGRYRDVDLLLTTHPTGAGFRGASRVGRARGSTSPRPTRSEA